MSSLPILVRQIEQKGRDTFSILWSDEQEQVFRLSSLQKMCPCADCIDEQTGQRRVDPRMVKENVQAIYIRSVGRYALQIHFTSGCSAEIYSFDMLRRLRLGNL